MITYGNRITPEEYMELRRKVGWCEFPLEETARGSLGIKLVMPLG